MYPDMTPLPQVPAPTGFDHRRFEQLMAMMGGQAGQLLDHAVSDLERVRRGLAGADGAVGPLREHSHVLSALAGTLGEGRLQTLSEDLNRAVHQGGTGDVSAILTHLDVLIAYLVSERSVL